MGTVISYPFLDSLDFAVWQDKYVTLKALKYDKIEVPKGFIFDGVTVKAPFTVIFSNKDLRKGIRASCFTTGCASTNRTTGAAMQPESW